MKRILLTISSLSTSPLLIDDFAEDVIAIKNILVTNYIDELFASSIITEFNPDWLNGCVIEVRFLERDNNSVFSASNSPVLFVEGGGLRNGIPVTYVSDNEFIVNIEMYHKDEEFYFDRVRLSKLLRGWRIVGKNNFQPTN